MLNSAGAGWQQALRVVVIQVAVTLATAASFYFSGTRSALAALAGGGTMALATFVAAWGAFGGGVAGAGMALGRLLLGVAMKWLIVIAGMFLAMAVWKLPAVPVLAGAALAAAAFVVSTRFVTKRSTTRTMA